MEFDQLRPRAPITGDAVDDDAAVPGKHTLTEALPVQRREADGSGAGRAHAASPSAPIPASASSRPRPTLHELFGVQRAVSPRPVGDPVHESIDDPMHVHAAAARGTATPASTLPYADQIQRAFGRHDISGIQAHVGPDAAASARAMGAQGYATGDHVVLGDGAGLHTAAHEAAHVVQQRGGVQLQAGVGQAGDAYERHADAVADCVVSGESAEATLEQMAGQGGSTRAVQHKPGPAVQLDPSPDPGAAPPGAPPGTPSAGGGSSGFSVSKFADKIADVAKKALFDEIKNLTGFDADAGTFDGNVDINEAIRLIQVLGKLDNLLVTGSNIVHLHIDFVGLSFLITADSLHLRGIANDATGFSCGSVDLSNVSIGASVAVPGTTVAIVADLHIGAAIIKGASFVEYQAGEPDPIKRLTADEVDLSSINAMAVDFALSGNRWFARIKLNAGAIKGMHYPGLPPTNVAIVKAGFTLDSIHGAIGSGGDGPALPQAPGIGLPKDCHIDVVVDRGDAGMTAPGSGVSLKLFTATAIAADNHELAKVEIRGLHADKSNDANAAGASIDFVHFTGDPKFTQALLDSDLVHANAEAALKVLASAGIKPSMGVDVTLTNVGVAGKDGTTTAKASLDASLDLGDLGQLHVALVNFDTIIETAEVDAAFDTFTATLTRKQQPVASVQLDGAGGKVKTSAPGAPSTGAASTKFKVTGNLPQLIDTFGQALPKLPRSVQKILPAIKALKVDASLSGSVSASKDSHGDITVNGDLDVVLAAAGNTTAAISLRGFRADQEGAITRGSFASFTASLKTAEGKEAASLTAAGVHGWVADGDGKSMTIPSLTLKGNGADLGALAGAISKKATALPIGIKDVCNAVATHAVAANGTVTITNSKAKLDAAGNQRLDAETLVANLWVNGAGSISIVVAGFVQTADAAASGKTQVTFDRLDAKLKTATKAEAATFSAAGDKVVSAGGATAFTAKKIAAQGDAAAIQQLLAGVQNNLRNLPAGVQSAIALVDEFKVNGSGQIDLSNVDVSKTGKDVKAKSDVHAEFKVPGVGKVSVDVKGFVADVQKASTDVAFDEFHAVLSGLDDKELAKFGVVISAPANPGDGTAAADPQHARVESTGEQDNRNNLFAAIRKNVATLPPQVETAIRLLQAGTTATADLNNVDLRSQDGKLVTRGDASFAVDVPDVGHVDLKIKGRDTADGADTSDMGGFKSLVLEVRAAAAPAPAGGSSAPAPAPGDPVASMEVLGGTIKQDKSFHAESFSVKGNGTLIASLLSDRSRALFPAEVAQWLGLFDKNQLKQGSGANLNVAAGGDGGLTTSVDKLTIDGAINLHDATGHTYVVPNALLTFGSAKLQLDAAHTAEVVDATAITAAGDFTYESPTSTVTGSVTAHSDKLHADIAPGAVSANLQGLNASGEVKTNSRKDAPAQPAPQPGAPAPQDPGAAAAAASLVKIVNLTTFTPVKSGIYGTTLNHLTVDPGTMLNIDVHIANGAIASAKVWFSPIPRFDGVFDVAGVHLQPEGQTGVLTADMGNAVTGWIANALMPMLANDYVGNAKKLPLDLTTLVRTVTEQMAKLPKKTPDGPSIGDIVGAIDIAATGGRGNLQLTASQDRTIGPVKVQKGSDFYLSGAAAGGAGASVALTAHADLVKAQAAGYAVDATGLSVGGIDAAKSGDKIKFSDLKIRSLNLSGVKPPAAAVQKHGAGAALAPDADVPRIAAAGVAGAGAPLPHADAIQRSFGRHDVSGVRAQVGGAGEQAARAIGAEAYATGDRVAFASAPDLRLAAHEAAHVVQQQSGVHLSGGVGHAGDPFEQHADAVADAVVRGGSAQPLLDALPEAGGGSHTVQKSDAPVAAAPAPDLKSIGVNIDDPLGIKGGLSAPGQTDDDRVRAWMAQHRGGTLITVAMPDLIHRVRREVGPSSPTIVTASNEDLLAMIHAAAAALQLPLPKDDLPNGYTNDEVKAAAAQGMTINAAFSVTGADGKYNVVAMGKTPEVPRDGVQIVVDPGGATLNSKDPAGNKTAISVDTNLGVKFSTTMGPIAFTAGIDANQWQVGIALGPDVPQLSTLPTIFANAQQAVSVAARNLASGSMTKPEALYESIKPHLPAIKQALATAQAAAKPGKVSVGVKATGPGYAPNQAEGAVQGITVMATLSVTF